MVHDTTTLIPAPLLVIRDYGLDSKGLAIMGTSNPPLSAIFNLKTYNLPDS